MIVRSFSDAVGQWNDPKFRRAIWFGLALAVALLFAMYAAVLLIVQVFTPDTLTLPVIGEVGGLTHVEVLDLVVDALLDVGWQRGHHDVLDEVVEGDLLHLAQDLSQHL